MTDSNIEPKVVDINGVDTVVRDSGGDANDAVVFVHGNPGSGSDWTQIMAPVSAFSRVLAADMPGL